MRPALHVRRLIVLLGLTVLAGDAYASDQWKSLRTEHFLFVGDTSESGIRAAALKLEQFRAAILQVLPPARRVTGRPIRVVVFDDARSFAAARQRASGRDLPNIGGYFISGPDADYIAVLAHRNDAAFRPILHEFSHALIRQRNLNLPRWVNEGLAQVYETFEERGSREGILGRAPEERVRVLRATPPIPLADLISSTAGVRTDDANHTGMFYAQSWALMHCLMFGSAERAAQLRRYIADPRAMLAPTEAFTSAFGDLAALEKELTTYTRRLAFPAVRIRFADDFAYAAGMRVEPLDALTASAYIGDLQWRIGRASEARALLNGVLRESPGNVRALTALGLLEERERHPDLALPLLRKAGAVDPSDPAIQAALGRLLVNRMRQQQQRLEPYEETRGEARTALLAVARLLPESPDTALTYLTLASIETDSGGSPDAAIALLRKGIALADDPRLHWELANVLTSQGKYDEAISELGPLVALGDAPAFRESARRRLGEVAELRNGRASAPGPATTRSQGNSASSDVTVVASDAFELAALGAAAAGNGPRRLRVGDAQVRGVLQDMTCTPGRVTVRIVSADRVFRLTAPRLDAIDFVTFRKGMPARITCATAAIPGVLATYLPAREGSVGGEGDGVVAAIEILPQP